MPHSRRRFLTAVGLATGGALVYPGVWASAQTPGPDIRFWAEGTADGLVLGAWVRNATASFIGPFDLRIAIPAGATVVESWAGAPGSNAGGYDGLSVGWINGGVPAGGLQGPFVVRIRGGGLGRASSHAWLQWSLPAAGSLATPPLVLNALAGDVGLRKTRLSNGLLVLTRERSDSESIAVALSIRAGSVDEDDATSGGSHWLEHAHFLGTTRRSGNQAIFGAIEAVGGDMNATTSFELTNYFNRVPAGRLDLALDVLSDQIINSTFPEAAFERERRVVFEELNLRANSPGTVAFDTFYSRLFRVHPARRLIGGYVENIRELPIATMLAYRAQRYVSGNMALSITGQINHDDAADRADRAFAGLARGPWVDRPVIVEPPATEAQRITRSLGNRQAELVLGAVGPSASSPDRPAFSVLTSILGSAGRRVAVEVADNRGLATSAGFDWSSLTDTGYWAASATTRPENVDEVVALIIQILGQIKSQPPSTRDIADAVRRSQGADIISRERTLTQAVRTASDAALGVIDSIPERLRQLESVTPADVQRVAQSYLDLENFTQVVVSY